MEKAKWLDEDTRHMLAALKPAPDQVTIAIGTGMMDLVQMWSEDDIKGTHLENNRKALAAWAGLWAEAGPVVLHRAPQAPAEARHRAYARQSAVIVTGFVRVCIWVR